MSERKTGENKGLWENSGGIFFFGLKQGILIWGTEIGDRWDVPMLARRKVRILGFAMPNIWPAALPKARLSQLSHIARNLVTDSV